MVTDGYAEKPEDDTVIALHVATGEGMITVMLSRRQFTALVATGGLAALLPDTTFPFEQAAHPFLTQAAAHYRQVLLAHHAGHHLLDPHAHISVLTRQMRKIDRDREGALPIVLQELGRVQSEYAEHVSWLYRETGNVAPPAAGGRIWLRGGRWKPAMAPWRPIAAQASQLGLGPEGSRGNDRTGNRRSTRLLDDPAGAAGCRQGV